MHPLIGTRYKKVSEDDVEGAGDVEVLALGGLSNGLIIYSKGCTLPSPDNYQTTPVLSNRICPESFAGAIYFIFSSLSAIGMGRFGTKGHFITGKRKKKVLWDQPFKHNL